MELNQINALLDAIQGCTFASLDAETKPSPGIRKITTGEQIILFSMKEGSGYENMVKRRLEEIGKDPAGFRVSDLPWGERVPNSPLIYHNGVYYLQTVVIRPGVYETYIGKHKVESKDVPWLRDHGTPKQGLPKDQQVVVRTYALENITRIKLLGAEVFSPRRPVLALKH